MKYCPKCKASYPLGQRFCANDGAALTLQDPYNLVGRTIAEKYRLDALVGMGGMGAVYSALHLKIERQIAVKILLPNLAIGNPRLVELFEREAKVVGRLKHENIVDIIDAGRTPDNIAYIAMEWLEGYTLEEALQWSGPLSFQRISEILHQIAAALQESHSQRIIHRDLKPSNIFLMKRASGREMVKVMDFGISKLLSETHGSPVSSLMGTPQYASPEQFKLGEIIDGRADIYSLGVVLFQMLTNALPFNDTTVSALIYKHLNEPPPPLRSLRQDIPPAVEELVNRMLAKQPADRPQRVGDLPALFDQALGARDATVVNEAPISEAPPELRGSQPAPPTQPLPQPPIQTPAQSPIQHQAQPPAQYHPQPPTQPPAQYHPQPPAQPPAQYHPQPPAQFQPRPPMQPPMHSPGQYHPRPSMQPPMQPPIQPGPSKRRSWPLVIGGAATIFVILIIGLATVWYLEDSAWAENMKAERRAFDEGRYLEAVNYAQAALKEAEAFGSEDSRLGASLHSAGELYIKLEKYDEAETLLRRALSIREKGNDEAETARTVYALARLNHARGNKEAAERLYRQSLIIRESSLGSEHPEVAESLSGMAGALPLKQIEEAERLARRSLSITEKALGENHPRVAESLSRLAEVILEIGKPDEIESYLRRAVTIRESSLGQTHPDLAESLVNLGVFLDKRGRCRDAEAPMRRALTIFEQAYGKDHPAVARSYVALASALAGQNKISEFERLIRRAITIFEKSSGRESRDVAMALSVRGRALTNLGRYRDAETSLLQSLAILEKSERMMGESVASAYLDLAALYSRQEAFIKSEDYLRRATQMYERILGEDHPVFSALLIAQAMNFIKLKKIAEAEDKLRQAEAGVQKASGAIRAPLASLSLITGTLLLLEKGENKQASEKIENLASTFEDSPLLFGDVVHFVYFVSVAQQTRPVVDGLVKMFTQVALGAGPAPMDQADATVQRIEIMESAAKRGLTLVEREQCKRNQHLLSQYKDLLAGLYAMKALCIDATGNHQDAVKVLRGNRSIIHESLKRGGGESDIGKLFSLYINLLRQTGRPYSEVNEIESFLDGLPDSASPRK